jgi:FixJ family two-component response regulator
VIHDSSIAVIEDDEPARRALLRQLNSAGFQAVGFSSGIDFMNAVAHTPVGCVVADMYLPIMDGLQLQAEIKRIRPDVSIVFITGHGDLSVGLAAIKQGAVDFLEKPVRDDALIESVRRGVDLCRKRRAAQARRALIGSRYETLTRREREVFDLVTAGLSNKQAGAVLGTTERTIKVHRGRVMQKMGANSLAALVQMAIMLEIRSLPHHPDTPGSQLSTGF